MRARIVFGIALASAVLICASVPASATLLCTTTGFADVTGDGKADAIAIRRKGSQEFITVWPSSGSEFLAPKTWSTRKAGRFPYDTVFLADVDGDHKADVVYVGPAGIDIQRSSGSAFSSSEVWSPDPIAAGSQYFVADVNGDGKADIVTATSAGRLLVRASSGTNFDADEDWGSSRVPDRQGPAPAGMLVGDITGDGRSDVVSWGFFSDGSGSTSSGKGFLYPSYAKKTISGTGTPAAPGQPAPVNFITKNGFGPEQGGPFGPMQVTVMTLADVTGDGRQDLFVTGATDDPGPASPYKARVGSALDVWGLLEFNDPQARFRLGLADVNGDGAADAIVVRDDEVLVYRSNFTVGHPGTAFLPGATWFRGAMSGNVQICR